MSIQCFVRSIQPAKDVDDLEICTMGYDYSHGSDFEINRPNGLGCWLLLLIKTPALFTVDMTDILVKANSFAIFTPEIAYRYHGTEEIYTDDWMHFNADEEDIENFKRLNIPINKPMFLGDIGELTEIMRALTREYCSDEEYSREIEKYYTRILFMKLSRRIFLGTSAASASLTEKNYQMTQLRTEITTQPERNMTIDEMAASLNMSRSGFQHLYKKMFGVSVTADIMRGKMKRAKILLSSTNLTVEEISHKCGYSNEYTFMRKFKEQCGKTPTEYRRSP